MSDENELIFASINGNSTLRYYPWHASVHAVLEIKTPLISSWGMRITYEHWNDWIEGLSGKKDVAMWDDRGSMTKISTINDNIFIAAHESFTGMSVEIGLSRQDARSIALSLIDLYNSPERQVQYKELEESRAIWEAKRKAQESRIANESDIIHKVVNAIFGNFGKS